MKLSYSFLHDEVEWELSVDLTYFFFILSYLLY